MINLKELRINNGLTQQELADRVGVKRQTISNIECGINSPSIALSKKLAKVLGAEWTDFFERDE